MSVKRVEAIVDHSGKVTRYAFGCPGCKRIHVLPIGAMESPRWDFNGDEEHPTFRPSILAKWKNQHGDQICHTFVTDGQIQFLDDCTNALARQTVELPPIDPELWENF